MLPITITFNLLLPILFPALLPVSKAGSNGKLNSVISMYHNLILKLRVRLVVVKRFPENSYFPEMLISGKGNCFPLFGYLRNRFPENHFRCLVGPNILRKSFYGKSIPVFDSSKNFTENTLRK